MKKVETIVEGRDPKQYKAFWNKKMVKNNSGRVDVKEINQPKHEPTRPVVLMYYYY